MMKSPSINSEQLSSLKLRLATFCALLLLTLSLAFALSAVFTDFWIQADSMRRNGTESRHNQMNSGLFHGVRQLDWAFGPKQKIFSVYDEIQSGVSFMDRNVWFGMLLSLGLGVLWNLAGIFVAMRNTTADDRRHERTALGPLGTCLWAFMGAVSYGLCILLFQFQFQTRIRANVLLPEEVTAGFSAENCTVLGFSFYLVCFALTAQMLASALVFGASQMDRTEKQKAEQPVPVDDSVFIY